MSKRGINRVILIGNIGKDPETRYSADGAAITDNSAIAFWSKVDISKNKNDCWNWMGARKPKGYGNVRIDKKYMLSHRVAFALANGQIPKGFMVCHVCDNPSCCNPSHLMLGTCKSNAADMLIKNRQKDIIYAARGEKNGNSKLTSSDVVKIRRLYERGAKLTDIADMHKVSPQAIGSIVRMETWRHV